VTGGDRPSARDRQRGVGAGLSAVLVALTSIPGRTAVMVPSRAQTPCQDVRPAELYFDVRAEPADPVLGEVVVLDVQIFNATDGVAAIPLFELVGAEPVFDIEAQENSYPEVAFARYWLRAVAPGLATLRLSVNFETAYGCADLPLFVFHAVRSPPYPVAVHGDRLSSNTPRPTATPTLRTTSPTSIDTRR